MDTNCISPKTLPVDISPTDTVIIAIQYNLFCNNNAVHLVIMKPLLYFEFLTCSKGHLN